MKRKNSHDKRTILIATGASGGHIFPALAVAEKLTAQGHTCVFLMGGEKFGYLIESAGYALEHLPASAFNVKNPIRKAVALVKLAAGFFKAVSIIHKHRPSVVFGTGGYATVAAVLAAKLSGVPTAIHEANVLPGKANKLLARFVDLVLITFPASRDLLDIRQAVVLASGNPVRSHILHAAKHRRSEGGVFRILVLGGSQGARVLSDVLPEVLSRLTLAQQKRVAIFHQARPEDIERVKRIYAGLELADVHVVSFVEDVGAQLVNAHLVICRAGSGTVAENNLIGRVAIYVPLPSALADNHQMLNAQVPQSAGAAIILEQPAFTPENVLPHVQELMQDREKLMTMELKAKSMAKPNAAQTAAEAVLELAKFDVLTMPKEDSEPKIEPAIESETEVKPEPKQKVRAQDEDF